MALCSYSSASTSISSKLSVSSSSLDSSFRILLQAKAAAMQSWLWAPGEATVRTWMVQPREPPTHRPG